MGQSVDANGRSVLHKGHGMTHTCAVPDVCKTPSPAGPVPIPYVNIAMDSNIADGATSVKIEGNPVANVAAKISMSSGDEPGTAGGILSSKFKGPVTWKMGSLDVKAEGKSVVRFLDTAFHNGNSFNTSFINVGQTAVAYADDFSGTCPICQKGPTQHRIHESPSSAKLCADLIEALRARFSAAADAEGRKRVARKRKGGLWGGYMVGVMVCKCKQSWGAMSGSNAPDFPDVAGNVVDNVIPGEGASQAELVGANTSMDPTKVTGEISKAWDRIIALRSGDDKDAKRGYNYPGACAGAKLLARSGHAALQMTEMFFVPPSDAEPWDASYRWLRTDRTPEQLAGYSKSWLRRLRQGKAARLASQQFTTGESVASCHTCQELLFMTMCPEKSC